MAEKLPIQSENLKDKSVIVTGGASGIGLATATKFAECGAFVTIADIQEEQGRKIASDLSDKGHRVTFVKTDVTDWNSSVAAFKHAVNFSPRKTLDVAALFAGYVSMESDLTRNIASTSPHASLDQDPVQPEFKTLQVNIFGVYASARLALHYFRLEPAADGPEVAPGKKSLILISSLAGYVDHQSTEYGVSKYAVRGLFRSLRFSSLAPESNFRVNVLAPVFVKTPMVTGPSTGTGKAKEMFLGFIAQNKMWAPVEYVVDAASLCATNEDVNGRSLAVWPYGYADLMEDPEHGFGGTVLVEHLVKSGYAQLHGVSPKASSEKSKA